MGNIIKPAVVLTVICVIVSAALAVTYNTTKPIIESREMIDAQSMRQTVLAHAEEFEEIDSVDSIVKDRPDLEAVKEGYRGLKDNLLVGFVFNVSSKGYKGDIQLMVGIDETGEILGVIIGDHNETPGLGTKINEESFYKSLSGFVTGEPLKVVKGSPTKQEEIEAISGATVSSKAVVDGVQAAVDMWAVLIEKEGV